MESILRLCTWLRQFRTLASESFSQSRARNHRDVPRAKGNEIDPVAAAAYFVSVMFGAAMLVTIAGLIRQPRRSTALLAAFLTAGVVTSILRGLISQGGAAEGQHWLTAISLAGEAITSLFIYEFTREFEHQVLWMDRLVRGAAIVLVITPFLLPTLSTPGETGTWYTIAYDSAAALFTVGIFLIVSIRFWNDARRSTTGVMKSRMQMITVGSIVFITGVAITAIVPSDSGLVVGRTAIGVAVLMLAAGCVPPSGLRAWWRRKAIGPLSRATEHLISIDNPDEVYDKMLPHIASLVGAQRVDVISNDGTVLATYDRNLPQRGKYPAFDFPFKGGHLRVHASRYAPVYGDDEFQVIDLVASHMLLAIDRCDRFQAEMESAQQLREADQIKTTFLAAVSHDLRNPLSVIVGFGHTIQDRNGQNATVVDTGVAAEQILDAAARLEAMLDSLLDLSRISLGRVELKLEQSNLREVALRVIDNASASTNSIRVRGIPLMWNVDAGKVERIIENLVVNAQRHTPQGSTIEVSVGHDNGNAVIKVDDNGPGIPVDMREHLFEPFERGNHAGPGGSGLGLTIVARLVELHNGIIKVNDSPLGGAQFEIRIPRITAGTSTTSKPKVRTTSIANQ